jgi:hypothetical protein
MPGTTNNIATTYAGEAAAGFLAATLLSGSTLANGGVKIEPNIKFKKVFENVFL